MCKWNITCVYILVLILSTSYFSRLNRKAKYNLEKDLKDKFQALSIDETNAELRNNSAEIRFKAEAAKIHAKYVCLT